MTETTESTTHAPCLLCGGRSTHFMTARGTLSGSCEHRVYRCATCDFGFLYPRPLEEELVRNYNAYHTGTAFSMGSLARGAISKFEAKLRDKVAWLNDRSVEMLQQLSVVPLPDEPSVCDVGCGDGRLLKQLLDRGIRGVGVEPSDEARRQAKNLGVSVVAGTAESIPDEVGGPFDLVVMSHVMEHTLDPVKAIEQCRARLRPGGSLVIEVPNNACHSARTAKVAWRWLDVPRHVNFFTPRSLCKLLEGSGFRIEQVCYRGFARMFSDEWIHEEQLIFDTLRTANHHLVHGVSRNSRLRAWRLLFRCIASKNDEFRYDSVRVTASR